MARHISDDFMKALISGDCKELLDYVKNDHTLDLELREDHVIVYYRGGKILSVVKEEGYSFEPLDSGYLDGKPATPLSKNGDNLREYFPVAKHQMDNHLDNPLIVRPKWEREIQQEIVRENNYSPNAGDTDYFVIDIEYADIGRADIVALRWDSTAQAHALRGEVTLEITIFEVKHGYTSIGNKKSGLVSHYNDYSTLVSDKNKLADFRKDMVKVFEQKRMLGLIPYLSNPKNPLPSITKVLPDVHFVALLVNYKNRSSELRKALDKLDSCDLIYANPMGYGLYAGNVVSKQDFLTRFPVK